jgi:hypothetical protein
MRPVSRRSDYPFAVDRVWSVYGRLNRHPCYLGDIIEGIGGFIFTFGPKGFGEHDSFARAVHAIALPTAKPVLLVTRGCGAAKDKQHDIAEFG